MQHIQLSTFQKDVFTIIESVRASEESVLIMQNGKSLVKIIPVSQVNTSWLGCMQSKGKILGDIVSPAIEADAWDVL